MSSASSDGTPHKLDKDGAGGDDDSRKDGQASAKAAGEKNENEESLKKQPWFWPYTSRDEAERRLAGQPDGTFLIRDCSVPGDFTLTVRKAGGSRCVRIYKHQNGYSLSAVETDVPFGSLQDLVDFYRHRSLATFNKRLDVCLSHALAKPASASSNQYGVFKELYDLSQDQLSAQTRLSVLHQQRGHLDQKFKLYGLMLPALRVVQQMYYDSMQQQEEQMPKPPVPSGAEGEQTEPLEEAEDSDDMEADITLSLSTDAESEEKEYRLSRDEEKSFTANTRLLLSRHSAMSDKLHSFKSNYDMVSMKLQDLDTELQYVEHTMLHMKRRQEELIRQMMDMGCQKEYLSQVLESRVTTREFDRSTWLRDYSREEALAHLEGLPHGAFLIRHKDKRHLPFVLSVVISGEGRPRTVQHCYIVRPHGRGYGFNPALAVFESIDQLVLRHRHVSLKHYFKHLDVMLTFPVGCQELLHRSVSESDRESTTVKEEGYANAAAIRDAMEDNVYEPVDHSEGAIASSELPDSRKKHRLTDLVSENIHSGRASAGLESMKKSEYESLESSRRHVAPSTAAAVSEREHQYESVDEHVKTSDVRSTKSNQTATKVPEFKPSKTVAVSDLVKEHKYETVGEPKKMADMSKGKHQKSKVAKFKPSKTAAISAEVKEHKYESVDEPSKAADSSSSRGNQKTMKEPKYEDVGPPSTKVEAAKATDSFECAKDHKYETISREKCSEAVSPASSGKNSRHRDENVYEVVINPVRHTAV